SSRVGGPRRPGLCEASTTIALFERSTIARFEPEQPGPEQQPPAARRGRIDPTATAARAAATVEAGPGLAAAVAVTVAAVAALLALALAGLLGLGLGLRRDFGVTDPDRNRIGLGDVAGPVLGDRDQRVDAGIDEQRVLERVGIRLVGGHRAAVDLQPDLLDRESFGVLLGVDQDVERGVLVEDLTPDRRG